MLQDGDQRGALKPNEAERPARHLDQLVTHLALRRRSLRAASHGKI
jgi:hypothetical protein